MHNANTLSQDEAAALTHELTAIRPDWNTTAVMAALARVHETLDRGQIRAIAYAATGNLATESLQSAFDNFLKRQDADVEDSLTPGPRLPVSMPETVVCQLVNSLPECFEELAAEVIVEHQFDQGVRKLSLGDGGPTLALRLLIDDLRAGQANPDDLDTALNILEVRLCIPLTTADDGA